MNSSVLNIFPAASVTIIVVCTRAHKLILLEQRIISTPVRIIRTWQEFPSRGHAGPPTSLSESARHLLLGGSAQ